MYLFRILTLEVYYIEMVRFFSKFPVAQKTEREREHFNLSQIIVSSRYG